MISLQEISDFFLNSKLINSNSISRLDLSFQNYQMVVNTINRGHSLIRVSIYNFFGVFFFGVMIKCLSVNPMIHSVITNKL